MMILVPAYGRDYKHKAEIVADFMGNKDFRIASVPHCGKYANREDLVKNEAEVKLKYEKKNGEFNKFIVISTETGETR